MAPAGAGKIHILKHLGAPCDGLIFIGVLKEKEKEKDNQYKLKKAMAIAIGLIREGSLFMTLWWRN